MQNNVLKSIIQNNADRANEPAFIFNNQPVSYSRVYSRSFQIAAHLQKQNIERQQTVGLLLKNGPQYLTAYYGCLLASVLPVLLPTYLSTNKLTYNFNKLKIEAVFFDPEFQKTIDEIELKKGTPLLKIVNNDLFLKESESMVVSEDLFLGINQTDEPAVITFTDGNSGFPKIAVHSQSGLLANALNCQKLIAGLQNIRLLCTLPVFHYISNSFIPHTVALTGGTIIMPDDLTFEGISQAIIENQVNIIVGTPEFFNRFVNIEPEKLNSLKCCIVAGGNLSSDTWHALKNTFNVFITEIYGMTETQMLATVHDESNRNELKIGRPFPGIDIRITTPSGMTARRGMIGELQVRTPGLMLNYSDELHKQVLNAGSWFKTGDLVRYTDDGALIFEGRSADIIHKYGYDINPVIIEKIIRHNPAVLDAFACPVKITDHDDQIRIYVVLKESATLNIDELQYYCQQNLPGYLWPDTIEIVTHFEYDLSGKILRNLLNKS